MIDELNIDETIDLTKLMEIVDARETKVFTVEECLDELKGYKGEIQEVE